MNRDKASRRKAYNAMSAECRRGLRRVFPSTEPKKKPRYSAQEQKKYEDWRAKCVEDCPPDMDQMDIWETKSMNKMEELLNVDNLKNTTCAMCQEKTNDRKARKIQLEALKRKPKKEGQSTQLSFCQARIHIFGREAKTIFTFPDHDDVPAGTAWTPSGVHKDGDSTVVHFCPTCWDCLVHRQFSRFAIARGWWYPKRPVCFDDLTLT